MLSLISFSHATKFSWPMAKLLKSRPNVLEEPFTNIAFQYFLPVPDRSIHELLVLCLSPMLQGPNSKIGKQCSLNSTSSDFSIFYSLHWCLAGPPPSGGDVLVKLVTAADRTAIWEMHSALAGHSPLAGHITALGTSQYWTLGTAQHWALGTAQHWAHHSTVHWAVGTAQHWALGTLQHWALVTAQHWALAGH